MEQQQQQPPQPPSSPITKTANITASNVLNQGIQNAVGVTRSTSTGSGGGSTVMSGNSGTAGSGTQGSLGNTSGTNNNNVRQNSMGSEVSNSFRSSSNPSPLNTPRNIPTNFANVGGVNQPTVPSNNPPPTNVAPPPWPTTTNNNPNNNNPNIPTSPQRSTQQPSIAAAVTMTPMRQIPSSSTQQSDKIPAGSISAGNTPLHGNTNTNFIRQQPTQSSNSGSGSAGSVGLQPPILISDTSLSFPQLSLSMTKSGEKLFSSGAAPNQGGGRISDGSGGTTVASSTGEQFNRSATDTSVLLGLEELERQQAHVEQRRAEEQQRVAAAEEQQRIQQQQQLQQQQQQIIQGQGQGGQAQMNQLTPRGLPPLAPTSTQQQSQQQRPNTTGDVPNQIQILEDSDENTLLSSEAGGASKSEMKRVVSIEKLRGSVSTVSSFIYFVIYGDWDK